MRPALPRASSGSRFRLEPLALVFLALLPRRGFGFQSLPFLGVPLFPCRLLGGEAVAFLFFAATLRFDFGRDPRALFPGACFLFAAFLFFLPRRLFVSPRLVCRVSCRVVDPRPLLLFPIGALGLCEHRLLKLRDARVGLRGPGVHRFLRLDRPRGRRPGGIGPPPFEWRGPGGRFGRGRGGRRVRGLGVQQRLGLAVAGGQAKGLCRHALALALELVRAATNVTTSCANMSGSQPVTGAVLFFLRNLPKKPPLASSSSALVEANCGIV